MRILYVAMKHDYGKPELGLSFEHHNFYHCLVHMGHELAYFDFRGLMDTHGQAGMNRRLLEVVRATRPELMFAVLFRDELDPAVVRAISERTDTVTFNWFCDDHWRFDDFTRRWAPCFNWVSTTAASALPKYERIGYRHVIKTQWACNPFLYRRLDLPLKFDVTFVGQPHGDRRDVIAALRQAGLDARAWGQGWENGRIDQEEMIRIFNQSRINLNMANASWRRPERGWRRIRRSVKRLYSARARARARSAKARQGTQQIKGRNFEVPGCGGFLLTSTVESLEEYYAPGAEVACYANTPDLIEKARYYLDHEDERRRVAAAGYHRTLGEHTYVHRFNDIFRTMGLESLPSEPLPDRPAAAAPAEVIT